MIKIQESNQTTVYDIVVGDGEYGHEVMPVADNDYFADWQINDNPSKEEVIDAFRDYIYDTVADVKDDYDDFTVEEKDTDTIDAEYIFKYTEGGIQREEHLWLERRELD